MTNTTETTSAETPKAAQGGGCRCGCGEHGRARRTQEQADQAAPAESATAEQTGTGQERREAGVVPGHKDGNSLGLRDVSARPAGASGGCGCGSH